MKDMIIDQSNMTEEFNGLAYSYDKFRPSYPEIIFHLMSSYLTVHQNSVSKKPTILDVGCGTGISTRQLFNHFYKRYDVIGLDPGEDMLTVARDNSSSNNRNIKYYKGRAESIPFSNNTINCIVVAQAIQWFERHLFLKEANRVLVANGCLFIIQNNRDWQSNRFLDEYECLLEKENNNYNRHYRSFDILNEVKNSENFSQSFYGCYEYKKEYSFSEYLGLSTSSTKVKSIIERIGLDSYAEKLERIFCKYQSEYSKINVPYKTEIFMFVKNASNNDEQ